MSLGLFSRFFTPVFGLIFLISLGGVLYGAEKYTRYEIRANLNATCGTKKNFPCVRDFLVRQIKTDGLPLALITMREWYQHNAAFRPLCDITMRAVGEELSKTETSTTLDFTPISAWCNYGIYHGYINGLIKQDNEALGEAMLFCDHASARAGPHAPGIRAECYRALGYGIAIYLANRHTDAASVAAGGIQICTIVAPTTVDRTECVSGIFSEMGRIFAARDSEGTKDTDPLALCDTFDAAEKNLCYGSFKWLPYITYDIREMNTKDGYARISEILGDKLFVETETVRQLVWVLAYNDGRTSTEFSSDTTYDDALNTCAAIPEPYRTPCIQAFAFGLSKGGLPGHQYREVLAFCARTSEIPQFNPLTCFSGPLTYLRDFYAEDVFTHVCKNFTDALGLECSEKEWYTRPLQALQEFLRSRTRTEPTTMQALR